MSDLTRAEVESLKGLVNVMKDNPYRKWDDRKLMMLIKKLCDSWLTLEARVRELEAANTRLTKLY